ncbi:MAG TPA: chemotaxis protein CheB, partial [Candidatus Eremiobacteraceae bacterium]|nr:chemotaxis protein CheB [Candidatus Eremiobacteraceae bacterium]
MTKARWARVLIVEDSPAAARLLVDGISRDQRLAVAGVALTAGEAVTLAEQLRPDVITVDLSLPDETGLDVVLRVLRSSYVPIIVVSSEPNEGGSGPAFRALLAGAADIVPKPGGDAASLRAFFDDLNERIVSLAKAQAVPTHRPTPLKPMKSRAATNGASIECVVVGASTGGPTALVEFLNGLGAEFPAPIVIVQHIAAPFIEGLVRWLDKETPLRVILAENGMVPARSRVYLAPSGADLVFD